LSNKYPEKKSFCYENISFGIKPGSEPILLQEKAVQAEYSMKGKVCLVTGGTSGIGYITARELAKFGAKMVITARNQEKAKRTVEMLRAESGNREIYALIADFASQTQVRDLAAEYKRKYDRLDVMINNAGAIYFRRLLSQDGIEMTFAVNHLAPFLLTNLLMDMVAASAPARIVNIASNAHEGKVINFNDLEGQKNYNFMIAYGQSKLANIMFTYELDRRLAGGGVTVNAVHPGYVGTNMGANNGWLVRLFLPINRLFAIDVDQGAETVIYLASSPGMLGISGKYYFQNKAVASSPYSHDENAARRLWEVSAKMAGLNR
jgi:NAD(P)-dependent dehydrogenase (short-subunit alcohol dehydrogenase family)